LSFGRPEPAGPGLPRPSRERITALSRDGP